MKGYSKIIGFVAVAAFAVVATVPALASNDKSQGNKYKSIVGLEHAKNVEIQPRVLLKGENAKKFKEEKEKNKAKKAKKVFDVPEIFEIKGKPVCGDGICQGNEPATCPVDCASEPEPDPEPEPDSSIMATGIIGADLVEGAEKYAIVIGICDYPDGLEHGDICTSDGDAQYMTRALHTDYDFPVENIYLFRDIMEGSVSTGRLSVPSHSATKAGIMGAIAAIRDLVSNGNGNDEVVFFFSGHGITAEVDGDSEQVDEALLVHNGIPNTVIDEETGELIHEAQGGAFESILDDELKAAFADFNTDRIAFIFDTCKAEGMNDVMEGAVAGDNGRVFVAASTEEGVAYVYSNGDSGEGLFSHYFVNNGMRGYDGAGGGWADGYNEIGWKFRTKDGTIRDVKGQDGYVVIEEAYEYAKEKIAAYFSASSLEQIPVLEDLFTNDLLLGRYVITE